MHSTPITVTSAGRGRGYGGVVLIGALVIDSVGNGLFLPLSLVFFTRLTDIPLALVGALVSVANGITLPIPIWAGALADRVGALPVVVAAQITQVIGYVAYDHVTRPVGVFVAVALVAIGVRFFWSSVFTVIADYADGTSSRLTKDSWFGWANMARTAGLSIGGLVTGAVIADGRDTAYHAVAYATATCFAAAALALAVFVRAPRHAHAGGPAHGGYRTMLRDGPFLSLTGINTIFAMTSMMLALALPTVVLTGLRGPAWVAPAVLVGNTILVSVFAAPVVRPLAHRRRTRVLMTAAALWAGWCFVLASLSPGHLGWVIPLLMGGTLLFTLAELIHGPISMGLATAISPESLRGRYLAAFQYSFTIAGIIAPAFFTSLFEIHHALPWIVLGAVNIASLPAVRGLERALPSRAIRSTERGRALDERSPS